MDTSFDELLNGPEAIEEPVADEPLSEPENPGIARDEHGRFASTTGVEPQATAEPVPPTEQAGLPKDVYEPLRAVRDENKALKDRLDALTQQIAATQQPQPAPAPSIWEDEQGWQKNFGGQVVSQAVQQASLNARLDMSEMMVRQANPDFDEVKAEFMALAEKNPVLAEQALADAHPWNKAYAIAKNHRAMTELGATDVETLKAKIREELMAEMQANPAPAAQGLPPTLSSERSVGSRSGPAWTGPAPLSDLLR